MNKFFKKAEIASNLMPGALDCLLWEQKLFVTSPQFSQLSSF